jgi:hypothetical protein
VINRFAHWLYANDELIDLITIWAVVLSAFVIGLGLLVAWLVLRDTRDQTRVGVTLKWQKLALSLAFLVNGCYWGIVLLAYYTGFIVDFWDKMVLRLFFAGTMMAGAVFVSLFIRELLVEIRATPPSPITLTHGGDTLAPEDS